MLLLHGGVGLGEDGDVIADVGDLEQARFDAIVEIGSEIGDLVGEIDDLGLDGWALIEEVERKVGVGGGGVVTRVLDDALADAEGEIEAAVGGVALLEVLADAEGVEVVVETEIVALKAVVEGALAGVAEGRVANVVDEGEGFGEVFVEAEARGDVAGDLCDLDGVGEAGAEVVGGAGGEDLGLTGEAAKGAGADDALAVALEGSARGAMRRRVGAGEEGVAGVSANRARVWEVRHAFWSKFTYGDEGGGRQNVRVCCIRHDDPLPLKSSKIFKGNSLARTSDADGVKHESPAGGRAYCVYLKTSIAAASRVDGHDPVSGSEAADDAPRVDCRETDFLSCAAE